MKKLMTIVLAVSFAIGAASMLVAQDKGKEGTPASDTEKGGKGKGKGGKGGEKGKAPEGEKGKAPEDKGKTN